MGTFGEKLQREREMRGITLEEIAEATKIGTRSLRALEEQDFDKLPGGIFNKGFVRAYSKYLGIDEEQAVADYVEAVNEAQVSGKLARPDFAPPPAVEEPAPEPLRVPWTLLFCIAVLVALGFAARSYYAKHGLQKLSRQPVETEKAAEQAQAQPRPARTEAVAAAPAPAQPEMTPKNNAPAPPALTTADGFVVKVHANEISWVSIEADGKLVASENMAANANRQIQATKQVVIKTGNAGGIEVTQNGKALPPIGPKHEVRTVTLTANGSENIQ